MTEKTKETVRTGKTVTLPKPAEEKKKAAGGVLQPHRKKEDKPCH